MDIRPRARQYASSMKSPCLALLYECPVFVGKTKRVTLAAFLDTHSLGTRTRLLRSAATEDVSGAIDVATKRAKLWVKAPSGIYSLVSRMHPSILPQSMAEAWHGISWQARLIPTLELKRPETTDHQAREPLARRFPSPALQMPHRSQLSAMTARMRLVSGAWQVVTGPQAQAQAW